MAVRTRAGPLPQAFLPSGTACGHRCRRHTRTAPPPPTLPSCERNRSTPGTVPSPGTVIGQARCDLQFPGGKPRGWMGAGGLVWYQAQPFVGGEAAGMGLITTAEFRKGVHLEMDGE